MDHHQESCACPGFRPGCVILGTVDQVNTSFWLVNTTQHNTNLWLVYQLTVSMNSRQPSLQWWDPGQQHCVATSEREASAPGVTSVSSVTSSSPAQLQQSRDQWRWWCVKTSDWVSVPEASSAALLMVSRSWMSIDQDRWVACSRLKS